MKIGAVTIGQSPRTDVAGEFLAAFGGGAELLQRGALDDLSLEEIRALAPGEGDYILVTRLRDGTEVRIAERHIEERMKACVRRLEAEGAALIVLFCTGEFPGLESKLLLLKPDVLLERLVPAVLGSRGRLGAVVPREDQIPAMAKKWAKTGRETVCAAVSPYSGTDDEFRAAARKLADSGVDLVALDCIGYNERIKGIFREITEKPVLLPRTLLGRIAGELAGGI